jgi:hypothetical protein
MDSKTRDKIARINKSKLTPEQRETANRFIELANIPDKAKEVDHLWIGPVVAIVLGLVVAVMLIWLLSILIG